MNEELLDDDLHSKEGNDAGFILTETSTFNLYEAAKWARISALVIIGFSSFKVISLFYYIYVNRNYILNTNSFISLLEPIMTIIVTTFLYSFGDKFLKGYKEDSDDMVDKSFLNLHKFYKFSVFVVAISISISVIFLLINGDLNDVIKYLFFIIPVGLLGFYFYQNQDANSTVNNQNNSTENK
jgi:chromate transport protein ChrA